ncbi:MAG TPA: glutamate racemase [Gaiellales bacterium]|jgi:glutamate racemase
MTWQAEGIVRIGVFDSGIGGLSVANAIERAMPEHEVVFRADSEHVPYGTRALDEIYGFTLPILWRLVEQDEVQVIVVACNTVTTNFIERLRQELPLPLVGLEPGVKPAAEATETGTITVCATPRTLESPRYAWLKETYAEGVRVLEPDCSDWSYMIETNSLDASRIAEIVDGSLAEGSDQIVLGCTHYHWIEDAIRAGADGRAQVLQPEQPVIEQLARVLAPLA